MPCYLIVDESSVEIESELQEIVSQIKIDLIVYEKLDLLQPQLRKYSEHLAGETLIQQALSRDICVARINLEARSSVTIELTTTPKFRMLMNGLSASLTVEEGTKLMLKGRDAARIAHQFVSKIQSVMVLRFGLGRAASQAESPLTGSLVGNLVMRGAFWPEAGLWLFAHIMYGDVKVSRDSVNKLIRSLGRNEDGLRINVDIDAEIVVSIQVATDGKKEVYLCLPRRHVFRVKRTSNLLSASPCNDAGIKNMLGCSIELRRGLY